MSGKILTRESSGRDPDFGGDRGREADAEDSSPLSQIGQAETLKIED